MGPDDGPYAEFGLEILGGENHDAEAWKDDTILKVIELHERSLKNDVGYLSGPQGNDKLEGDASGIETTEYSDFRTVDG